MQNISLKAQKLLGKSNKWDKALANIREHCPEMAENRHELGMFFYSQSYHYVFHTENELCQTLNTLTNSISHCFEHLAMKHAALPLKQNGCWTGILKSCTGDRREDNLNQSKEKKITACVHKHSVKEPY